ncbi:hypothetical protein V5O48_005935 [Marasmius crinis-equi]|uniref:Uncharacterized protein n=1 Tax=Marasmius crinis-equi TaxID=585013 RepID=A0ABR3FL26_9AGAR
MNRHSGRSSSPTEPTSMWNESSPLTELSPSPALPLDPVKLEPCSRPTSPHFIIEPLLPSAVHKSTSSQLVSHRRSQTPATQTELAEQLLLSQSLAPPTQVPLRATHATSDMLEMMGSFRLNPFAFHTRNKAAGQREDVYLTWCGEEPKPLDEEPVMIEWQLEGYSESDGTLEDLNLIRMDEVSCSGSDDAPSPLHDSNVQLPFPFTTMSQSTISSPDAYRTPVTPPTISPGPPTGIGTQEHLMKQPERGFNDQNSEILSTDSGDARFRLPAAAFPGFPGVPLNHSESDLRFDSPLSSSSSSPLSSCYRRSGSTECFSKPHTYVSRPYPSPAERGRLQLHPGNSDPCPAPDTSRYRGPIDSLNKPGCGVNNVRYKLLVL